MDHPVKKKYNHQTQLIASQKNVTLVAHNWGFLSGAAVIREQPDLFDRLVILNVNSLPDGELVPSRFPNLALASIMLHTTTIWGVRSFPRF